MLCLYPRAGMCPVPFQYEEHTDSLARYPASMNPSQIEDFRLKVLSNTERDRPLYYLSLIHAFYSLYSLWCRAIYLDVR